jgi:hypothetical protein
MRSPPKMKWSVPNRRSEAMQTSLSTYWPFEAQRSNVFATHFFLHVFAAPKIVTWIQKSQSFVEHR